MSKNFTAVVSYDGTRYSGFQVQPNAPTVQGELERALERMCGEPIRIAGAGRTDAGVHATGQVISFRSATQVDPATLRRGVNALLPADIAIRDVEEAGEHFHARFSATGRTYEYRIRCAPQREPLERHREHWLPQALDLDAMRCATAMLPGRRDVAAFAMGSTDPMVSGSTERTIRRAEWSEAGTRLRFEIEADAFLRGMVRAIVGTLLWVGTGHIGPQGFGEVLASRDRQRAGPNAPAAGLCLVGVSYGGGSAAAGDDEWSQ